ncbi:hypothetical protein ACJMK2_004439 [Sinanodonta woodiana]|uniref:Uncharacterized protein n=1 Tax=Sinanodonta woodiana TaxID=1069815 RepID=A0ABD3Y3A0_SINWO
MGSMMHENKILLILYLLLSFTDVFAQICSEDLLDGTQQKDFIEKYMDSFQLQAIPKGRSRAGVYKKDTEADDVWKCITSCCLDQFCNVALFTQGICFSIECNISEAGLCEPEHPADSRFNDTVYVRVRKPVETSTRCSASNFLSDNCGENEHCVPIIHFGNVEGVCECKPGYTRNASSRKCVLPVTTVSMSKECTHGTDEQCGKHQKCHVEDSVNVRGICICDVNYMWDETGTTCIWKSQTCEEGLLQCGYHELCAIKEGSKSRQGLCRCESGYSRDDSGACIKEIISDKTSVAVTKVTTVSTLKECTHGTDEQCGKHQKCHIEDSANVRGICICDDNYIWDETGTSCIWKSQTCMFGLQQCIGIYETCTIKEGSKSRQGLCKCEPGYSRDDSGACVKAIISEKGFNPISHGPTSTVSESTTAKPTQTSQLASTPKVQQLTVSAGESKVLQLPDSEITLNAYVVAKDPGVEYHYEWSLEAHPEGAESGNMEGKTTDTLILKNLIAGLYTFRVQVTAPNMYGEAYVNVTVLPPKRENKPPVAIIKPTSLQIKLPNSGILDGSASTDDDTIASYHWDEVSGPLRDQKITEHVAILTLKDLVPGNYTFKLTVIDSDGASNSTTADVTVIKEMDYPPIADAGSDLMIHLPQNYVILYGNKSTDDKGIASYEWVKSSGNVADMTGVRTPLLHLSNLEVGDYTFTLKVIDIVGQSSTADVHIVVKPEVNVPPKIVLPSRLEVYLPLDNLLLDGSNSTDDKSVLSYKWYQISGPTTLTTENADRAVATAKGEIRAGEYKFNLTVKDTEGLYATETLIIMVIQNTNEPPVADAGGDQVVMLPKVLVTLDGSRSHDDHGVVSYHWERNPESLSAGRIVNNSENHAVLQLVNLIAGRYVFTLTVLDAEGLSSQDKASVLVKEDERKNDLIELAIDADIRKFTEENKKNLEGQLALLLPKYPLEGETVIDIQDLQEEDHTGYLKVLFYAYNKMRDSKTLRNGVTTLQTLKKKLLSNSYVLDFKVVYIDTYVCQNNCSNHGHCDLKSKHCVCAAFWMENFFLYLIEGESNCDWSILYVVIISFLTVIGLSGTIWACICFYKRKRCRCRFRSKKRHRYSLLHDIDDDKQDLELVAKGKMQNTSVMISESDFSSEEETIFVNHNKKTNGHIPKHMNGISKLKTKLKT